TLTLPSRAAAISHGTKQAQQPIDRRERMGPAPRNPQVHRQDVADAARDLRAPRERAPADGARAHGDYELRRWHGLVRFLEREPHVGVDRSSDDDPVGVSRGGHELHAEATEVEHDIAQGDELGLAAVAAPRHDRPQLERSPEQATAPLVEGVREIYLSPGRPQRVPARAGHAVVGRVADRPGGTGKRLLWTEEAGPEI